ncbi:Glycosyltransferase family 4 protein [Venustampulla echinocandica]|uniref:Glycosyltransferase family 4 protein n=1 Tax=Venustampulla echinocandica TaxID=2656787 RepID=A0A370U0F2_9HELO|nr:Glycosyltransferase family 4 protein [Venustampulla echinocandica]RDL41233.1 Glycosyltransferase family 4 protein [Venustampulla echinocandica]
MPVSKQLAEIMNRHKDLFAAHRDDASEDSSYSGAPALLSRRLRLVPKHLRAYVYAAMAFKQDHNFSKQSPTYHDRKVRASIQEEGRFAAAFTPLFVGMSAAFSDTDTNTAMIATAIHDSCYLIDFAVQSIDLKSSQESEDPIADHVVKELKKYEQINTSKFVGAGIPWELVKRSPRLCSRLWLELDIIPITILTPGLEKQEAEMRGDISWADKMVDEQADSVARKCIMHFGPNLTPLLQVGWRGAVEVDSGFQARLLTPQDFKTTCSPRTWDAMMKFVLSLKERGTKIAFFSSTPQGGGVALMRHALIRLAMSLGVDLNWYVPKPKPGVFRITKNMHNILQGVSKPHEAISAEDKAALVAWIQDNASRYWLNPGGPLRPPEEGGAHVIIIDDPQMPGLIPLIKEITPDRPVLYRSHIQIHSALANIEGTPQHDVWQFLWANIKLADLFISHPIPSFVPENVPRPMTCYLPATTVPLNKDVSLQYVRFAGKADQFYRTELRYPEKKYIIQIARFDPAKGIPDVIEAYAEFRRLLIKKSPLADAPQLAICGNGSIDDPDGAQIYDQTMATLETRYPDLLSSVSVMRLQPNDQLLNALISSAHFVLQFSTREGFEVKVSEALHKGKPVIATNSGGIPLQVQDKKNGYLIEPGDWQAAAAHMINLWTDEKLYKRMCDYASKSVSDEVGTVGNALSWFYLADKFASGEKLVPNCAWVNDMAREAAGIEYEEGENRLPRSFTQR